VNALLGDGLLSNGSTDVLEPMIEGYDHRPACDSAIRFDSDSARAIHHDVIVYGAVVTYVDEAALRHQLHMSPNGRAAPDVDAAMLIEYGMRGDVTTPPYVNTSNLTDDGDERPKRPHKNLIPYVPRDDQRLRWAAKLLQQHPPVTPHDIVPEVVA